MPARRKAPDLAVRKQPVQERSRQTFDAIVEACAWLLAERGYAGTTTNHIAERAGVNIASLYEYFPGKDAIVARVAERLVDRVLSRLEQDAARVMRGGEEDAIRRWIERIHASVGRERRLVAVFLYQVPYTNELPSVRSVGARLRDFSERIQRHAGGFVHPDFSAASLHLVINLVTSTILQLVLDPPGDVGSRELLDELIVRTEAWIRRPLP